MSLIEKYSVTGWRFYETKRSRNTCIDHKKTEARGKVTMYYWPLLFDICAPINSFRTKCMHHYPLGTLHDRLGK